MQVRELPVDQAIGHILCHNIVDGRGHKVLKKGQALEAGHLPLLRDLGLSRVYVAQLSPDDVHEDEAAARLASAAAGPGLEATRAATGRVNLLAAHAGVVKLDAEAMYQVNSIPGLTIATLPAHTVVTPKKMVATVKVIPFAVPQSDLDRAEGICRQAGRLIEVLPLQKRRVALILTGSERAREKVFDTYEAPIRGRVEELGSELMAVGYASHDETAIADAIREMRGAGAEVVILASETSVMDEDDITPRAIRRAGGEIEHYGVPVEPGNLLMLAYMDNTVIMGAPGCARSRATNVVDLVLPRILAGEHLSREDLISLGPGGLLL